MSSNKKKNNKKKNNHRNANLNKNNIQSSEEVKNKQSEIDESDKIIEQLDKIEKMKESSQNEDREDMSSRVKNLIKSDKEAIKKMKEQMVKLDEDDELDYLDDEKIDFPVVVKESDKTNSKGTKTNNSKDSKNNISNGKKNSDNKKQNNKNENSNIKTQNKVKEEKDVNLDFFENMAREDEIHYNKISKQQPNSLKKNNNTGIKEYFTGSVINIAIVSTIAMLLIIMFVALIITNKKDEENKNYNFIEIEETGFIESINNYYESLGTGNVDEIREYIFEGEELSNADILKLTEEQMFLSEFFFSDILDKPFEITDCYVLEGMKKKEYIVLMKYQFTIRDCNEPATGIFSWYMIDISKNNTPDYKISIEVGDTSSEIYRYVCKMENMSVVTELVDTVNKELVESCKKDDVLRKIIFNMYDEMIKSGDKIDDSFRNMILELKEYEEQISKENESADDSTTVAPETTSKQEDTAE